MNYKVFVALLIASNLLISCSKDEFLDNYNRQELFAQPTQAELDAVLTDWKSRDLSPADFAVEQTVELTTNGTLLKIVSFKVSGNKEYGALIVPKSETPLPVRMNILGFSYNLTAIPFSINLNDNEGLPFIYAIPALRGQSLSLTINGVAYTSPISEGRQCDAFDGAADDAIAFLNVIESTESNADTSRVAASGGSRGATVAFLMSERDKRVKRVLGIAGPTNLLELTSKMENDLTYQCQFLSDLVNETATIAETRHKMIASSPIYFAENLPLSQLHLGKEDKIVPVSQGETLEEKIIDLGISDKFQLFVYENRNHEDIAVNNEALDIRVKEFFSDL